MAGDRTGRSGPVVLHRAEPSDAHHLAALHARAFDRAWSKAEFRDFLAQDTCSARLALTEGSIPVGLILWRRVENELELLTLGVPADHRRLGIARVLMRDMIRAADGTPVLLEVGAGNTAAIGLYTGFGFRAVGRRIRYYRRSDNEREDAIVMRRDGAGATDAGHEN